MSGRWKEKSKERRRKKRVEHVKEYCKYIDRTDWNLTEVHDTVDVRTTPKSKGTPKTPKTKTGLNGSTTSTLTKRRPTEHPDADFGMYVKCTVDQIVPMPSADCYAPRAHATGTGSAVATAGGHWLTADRVGEPPNARAQRPNFCRVQPCVGRQSPSLCHQVPLPTIIRMRFRFSFEPLKWAAPSLCFCSRDRQQREVIRGGETGTNGASLRTAGRLFSLHMRVMGVALAQTLTPPPPPWEVQSVEEVWTTFGPNLALKGIRWGVKIDFTLCVYAQNAQNFMGDSNMRVKQEKSFQSRPSPPQPPPPPPPSLGAGTGLPVGNFFSKPPHMCVQNDQRNEGISLRYVCRGNWDPPMGAPPPPPKGVCSET